ncbi:hypothetical protein PV08_10045 [Exophiala spinifera]|uniref:Uncharacterized protein n=1 Tax=Exophiala spinifera TaxID=91928 RepID=A0A0D1Y762_9EURO|nr:uncharacterized protein PV08_10045 [Exophiala spinifera]KIW10746.1 hypothetical protein PV08_10045 [Exophiala spinifera]
MSSIVQAPLEYAGVGVPLGTDVVELAGPTEEEDKIEVDIEDGDGEWGKDEDEGGVGAEQAVTVGAWADQSVQAVGRDETLTTIPASMRLCKTLETAMMFYA